MHFCLLYLLTQIKGMFDWLIQPCIDFVEGQCRFVIKTSPIHLTSSLMKLYTCLISKWGSFFFFNLNSYQNTYIYVFCYILS